MIVSATSTTIFANSDYFSNAYREYSSTRVTVFRSTCGRLRVVWTYIESSLVLGFLSGLAMKKPAPGFRGGLLWAGLSGDLDFVVPYMSMHKSRAQKILDDDVNVHEHAIRVGHCSYLADWFR